jgi:hypothetical protein
MKRFVSAQLEQGAKYDYLMLLSGIAIIAAGVLTLRNIELDGMVLWERRDDLWLPIVLAGVSLCILNLILQVVRPKLLVNLLEINAKDVTIRLPRNLVFSGYTDNRWETVQRTEIKTAKVFDFRTNTGTFWISFELNTGRIIEGTLHGGDGDVIPEIVGFIRDWLPDVDLVLDEKLKI